MNARILKPILLLVVLASACRSSAPVRDDESPATSSSGQARARVAPPPPPKPGPGELALRARLQELTRRPTVDADGFYWRAASALHLDNDAKAADGLASQALSLDPAHPRALLLRCAISNQQRRYAEFLDHCARVAERAPSTPEAEVALALMAHAQGQFPQYAARMSTTSLGAVDGCAMTRSGGCAELATSALTHALGVAGKLHDLDLYLSLVQRAGLVTAWTAAGPYGPPEVDAFRRQAGFAAQGIPADEPAPPPTGGIFTRMTRSAPDGLLFPARHAPAGLWAVQSYIHVPRPARMVIDLRASTSARVYVDGQLLATVDQFANAASPRTLSSVVAVPGWHRVVVELAAEERDHLQLRVMGEHGSSPVDMVMAELPNNASLAPAVTPAPPMARGLDALVARAQRDPADVEAALGAVVLQGSIPVVDMVAARAGAERAAEAFPRSARVLQALATALEDDRTIPTARRTALVRLACTSALELDPSLVMARYRLAVQAQHSRPDEALDALKEVARARPDYPHVWRSLAEVYRVRGWHAEAIEALQKALTLGATDGVLDSAALAMQMRGDVVKAQNYREQAARLSDNPFSPRVAEVYADRLDEELALREWEQILRYHPDHPDQDQRLSVLRRMGEVRAWRAALEQHLQRFPSDGEAQIQLCNALRAQGDTRGLRGCMDRVRVLVPSSAYPERLAAELKNADLGDEPGAPPVADVHALIAHLKEQEAAGAAYLKDQPTVVLLDSFRRVLHRSGAGWFVKHRVIRVGTREAADTLGEVLFDSIEEKRLVRVIKPDGSVVEPEVGQAKAEISISGLAPGDVLELRTVGVADMAPSEGIFSESFFLADQFPVMRAEYLLEIPEELMPLMHLSSTEGVAQPVVTRAGGMVKHHYRAEQVLAVTPEPFAAPPLEHLPRVLAVLRAQPDVDARLTCRRVTPSGRPSPELEALARSLKQKARSEGELLDLVLADVRTRIQPDGAPVDAREALAEGRGSHLTTVRTLLRLAGIPARVVAARGVFGARTPVALPGQHDVLLLVVPVDGKERVLTAFGPWLLEGPLPPVISRDEALEADCDEPARLGQPYALGPVDDSAWEHQATLDVALSANGDATGTLKARVVGAAAPSLKREMGQATEQQLQQWFGSILVQSVPGADLTGVDVGSLSELFTPLDVQLKFRAGGLARPTGTGLAWDRAAERPLLRAMVGGMAPEEYLRLAERRTPLLLSRPMRERTTVNVTLPAGATLVRQPRSFRVEGEGFLVSQEVKVQGNTLTITRVTRVDPVRIAPSAYPAWRASVEQAVQQGRNRVEFRVDGASLSLR